MQKNYGRKFDISRPGFKSGLGQPRVQAITNSANSLADVWTLTLPAPAANTTYSVTASNKTATIVTGATAPTAAAFLNLVIDAIQQSEVFDVFAATISGANIRLVARLAEVNIPVTVVGFTVANTVVAARSSMIPFGRFVAKAATDALGEGRLPTSVNDKLLGVSFATYFAERDAIGSNAKTGYKPDEVMDIFDRANDCQGVWVECIEPDLNGNDVLHVSTIGDNRGKLTRVVAGGIAIPATSYSVAHATVSNTDGTLMLLLSLNMP